MPAAWILLTVPFTPPYKPASRTKSALRTDVSILHAYVDKYKKTPPNLGVLRAFAAANKLRLATYDAYGERIDYLRLDDQHFLMRSYGEDQIQNSLFNAPDIGVTRWGDLPERPLTYTFPDTPHPDFYPASLLLGAEAPGHAWLARLFIDQDNVARRLIVRHLTKSGLFMVAPHDGVEEFLWLPGGERIVFTATASARYRDGLYVWDLRDDTVINLLDIAHNGRALGPASKDSPEWLSLAGVSKRGPVVYAYEHPRHDGGLRADEFFQRAHLVAFAVPPAAKARMAGNDEFPSGIDAPSLTKPLDLRAHLDGIGLPAQHQWLQLPQTGNLEAGLLAWHAFADANSGSPLYPYALWILYNYYSQGFAELKLAGETAASDTMRSYATEIARALLNYPLAPSYLRALTLDAYDSLMEGAALPFRFGHFTPGRGGKPAAPGPVSK